MGIQSQMPNRRQFVRTGLAGLAALPFGSGFNTDSLADEFAQASRFGHQPHFPARAKRVIFLFMLGGPSQYELFENKPKLREWDGQPISVRVCWGHILSLDGMASRGRKSRNCCRTRHASWTNWRSSKRCRRTRFLIILRKSSCIPGRECSVGPVWGPGSIMDWGASLQICLATWCCSRECGHGPRDRFIPRDFCRRPVRGFRCVMGPNRF